MEKLKMYVVLLLTAVLLVPLGSCDKCKGTEEVKQIAFQQLYSDFHIWQGIYPAGELEDMMKGKIPNPYNRYVNNVINTQDEYNNFVTWGKVPLPEIDFTKYTLVTGFAILSSGGRIVSQNILKECDEYAYYMTVEMGYSTAVLPSFYSILIPKILPNSPFKFQIEIKEPK